MVFQNYQYLPFGAKGPIFRDYVSFRDETTARVLRFKGYILCCMYAFISVGGTKPLFDAQQGRAFQEVLAFCNRDNVNPGLINPYSDY